jgi:hypothetical protein
VRGFGSKKKKAGGDRLSKTTRLAGIALIAAGTGLGALSFRMASRDNVREEPAVAVAASAD